MFFFFVFSFRNIKSTASKIACASSLKGTEPVFSMWVNVPPLKLTKHWCVLYFVQGEVL